MRGMSMRTGHASTQAPQSEEACARSFTDAGPCSIAVRRMPIGPGYVCPYACPPICWYTGHTFRQAPQRRQESASRSGPAIWAIRPWSSRTRWNSSGPSSSPARRGPSTSVVYTESFWPVALLARIARNTIRSVMDGTTFSTPMIATCTRGSDVTIRPFPSLVTSTTVPVSATAKLAPVIPRSAWRNFSRSSRRATRVSTSGSASTRRLSARVKRSATCPFVLWMAGTMMCEGRSWASWMMYSPRSVSTGVTPAASSASLRWISSVAMDLDFTAIRAPVRRAMSSTIARASSGVVA